MPDTAQLVRQADYGLRRLRLKHKSLCTRKVELKNRIVRLRMQRNGAASVAEAAAFNTKREEKKAELQLVEEKIVSSGEKVAKQERKLARLKVTLARHKKAQEEQAEKEARLSARASLENGPPASLAGYLGGTVWVPSAYDNTEYDLSELVRLAECIDEALAKLKALGMGGAVLFNEIEELKDKSKKISRKDLRLLTISKLVSFGAKEVSPADLDDIFKTITGA